MNETSRRQFCKWALAIPVALNIPEMDAIEPQGWTDVPPNPVFDANDPQIWVSFTTTGGGGGGFWSPPLTLEQVLGAKEEFRGWQNE